MPRATDFLGRQSMATLTAYTASGITTKSIRSASFSCAASNLVAFTRLENARRHTPRTAPAAAMPDNNACPFFTTRLKDRDAERLLSNHVLSCCETECLQRAVALPNAQRSADQSPSTKSISRSMASPQAWLSAEERRTIDFNSCEAILRITDVNPSLRQMPLAACAAPRKTEHGPLRSATHPRSA